VFAGLAGSLVLGLELVDGSSREVVGDVGVDLVEVDGLEGLAIVAIVR